jgi:spermidine/putrescine transport system substrate-binding protein
MKTVPCLLLAVLMIGCSKAAQAPAPPKQLNIYIWSEYLPQSVLDEFTRRTGIAVTVDTYDSNETLMAKLASGVAGYDLVVPSDYIIQPLIRQQLIAPLDKSRLTNLPNLDPSFLNQHFDPGNQYSIPYLWGTTGLAYNKKIITSPVTSWDVLFDPQYSGRILMLNDMRECFVVALKKMGKSVNETDPAVLAQAADLLKKQHALVRAYDSENYDRTLEGGDVVVAQGWNGQMAKVVSDRPDEFAYVLPREGGTIWMDNVCIPTTARNPDAAYLFINYILEPKPAAAIVNGVNYASPNAAARQFIDPKILNDRNIYPTPDMLKGWEFLDDLGKTSRQLDELWTEIKAQ